MKTIEEVERLSNQALEEIAADTSVSVPPTLRAKLDEAVLAEELHTPKETPAQMLRYAIPAFVAAAIALVVLFVPGRTPKDTFQDPAQAYAEVEKAFNLISDKVDTGLQLTCMADRPIETINNVFNK